MADQSEFMTILPSSRASPKWVPGGHTLDKQIGRQPATPAQLPAAHCRATSLVTRWQADRFLGRAARPEGENIQFRPMAERRAK
jgi:hypothetical protein